jgi:uncharacterized membrane protein
MVMSDFALFIIAFVLGYLVFMGIIIFIGKIVFPFLTKEEQAKRNLLSLKK